MCFPPLIFPSVIQYRNFIALIRYCSKWFLLVLIFDRDLVAADPVAVVSSSSPPSPLISFFLFLPFPSSSLLASLFSSLFSCFLFSPLFSSRFSLLSSPLSSLGRLWAVVFLVVFVFVVVVVVVVVGCCCCCCCCGRRPCCSETHAKT